MKNHELLDMIGDVNEDYVLDVENNVVKPRFGWKKLAACAACAALVLGAYPVYRAFNPPLHSYTVVEDGGTVNTLEDAKAPAGGEIDVPGQNAPGNVGDERPIGNDPSQEYAPNPNTMPGGANVDGGAGQTDIDGAGYSVPGQNAPIQEAAAAQYDNLMKNGGIQAAAPNPDWYGGAWIDNSYYPEAKLAVAIVDGFRTPELEAQILDWCGGEVVFQDAKYSLARLYALQDSVVDAITGGNDGLSCGIGVDVTANCLGVDIYSDGAGVPNAVLAELARLDPKGDAIRVRVFTGRLDTLADEAIKGPAPDGDPDAYAPDPGAVEDAEQKTPRTIPEPNAISDLPQAHRDIFVEPESE